MLTALMMIVFFGCLSLIVGLHDRMHSAAAPPARRAHPVVAAKQVA
jgi:hypothetical protein